MLDIGAARAEQFRRIYSDYQKSEEKMPFPEDLDQKIRGMAAQWQKEEKRKKRRRVSLRLASVLSVVVLFFFISSTMPEGYANALRIRIFTFLRIEHEDHTQLTPQEINPSREIMKNKLPPDWTQYYYPSQLPDGYRLKNAEIEAGQKIMTFSNDCESFTFTQREMSGGILVDNERTQLNEVKIGRDTGYWWKGDSDIVLYWAAHDLILNIRASDAFTEEDLLNIAESITFVEESL